MNILVAKERRTKARRTGRRFMAASSAFRNPQNERAGLCSSTDLLERLQDLGVSDGRRPSETPFLESRQDSIHSSICAAITTKRHVRCGCSLLSVWSQDPPIGRIKRHLHGSPRAIPWCGTTASGSRRKSPRTRGAPCSSLHTGHDSYLLYPPPRSSSVRRLLSHSTHRPTPRRKP